MDTSAPERDPAVLLSGTKVGAWRVQGLRGRGTYGLVYRAVSLEPERVGPVALKLAVYPGDRRFECEVELLSRIRHPSVPRLLDAGEWLSPLGEAHPFIVMEWVEGEPLYAWAARRNPSSRQVLALMAQAARALQAVHEVSAVHRDVKGDNMLVRPTDGRLFLTDLGGGYFAGAPRLTPWHVLLGTPEYHSPELWESTRHASKKDAAPALARPSDDLFALGVTAYRLVTDTYPPMPLPDMKAGECWRPGGPGAPPPRKLNPRVDAQLNALILRMLSLNPVERGCARELAEAMERGVAHAGPSADVPLFEWETLRPSQWTRAELADAKYLGHRPRHRDRERVLTVMQRDAFERAQARQREEQARTPAKAIIRKAGARSGLSWLAAVLALGLWPAQTGSVRTGEQLTGAPTGVGARRGPVSLGDTAQSSSTESEQAPTKKPVAKEMPRDPLPGQRRPDSKGRCPNRQVAINGACWAKVEATPEDCPENMYLYQGGCYFPMFTQGRVPTAAPPER